MSTSSPLISPRSAGAIPAKRRGCGSQRPPNARSSNWNGAAATTPPVRRCATWSGHAADSTTFTGTCSSAQVVQWTDLGDVSSAEVDRMRAVYEPLAGAVRELIDATIRTEVDADTVAVITDQIEAATAR